MQTDEELVAAQNARGREIASIAQRQLAAWQEYCQRQMLIIQIRSTPMAQGNETVHVDQWHFCCDQCGDSVIPIHDGANPYRVNPEMILDRTVSHFRRKHEDLESYVYSVAKHE